MNVGESDNAEQKAVTPWMGEDTSSLKSTGTTSEALRLRGSELMAERGVRIPCTR